MNMIIMSLLSLNKILQHWKHCFSLKIVHIFSLFSNSCTTLYKNSNFSLSWALPDFVQKLWLTLYLCANSCTNYDLNSGFMCNFVQKHLYEISFKKIISCKNTNIWVCNKDSIPLFINKSGLTRYGLLGYFFYVTYLNMNQ